MNRREFLTASAAAGVAPLTLGAAALAGEHASERQTLELRTYHFADADRRAGFLDVLGAAAIPAWNRIGVKPVGVFQDPAATAAPGAVYVLLPHASPAAFTAANARLLGDAKYLSDGSAVHDAPKKEPLYARYESQLMLAFEGAPRVETPAKGDGRLFQLRIYESHNAVKAARKVEMFNTGGELDLFREAGMTWVFFGESLAGTRLPNLTYMLGFDSEDAQQAAWKAFGSSAGWKKLRGEPRYKDTVSRITNIILKPASCSQV